MLIAAAIRLKFHFSGNLILAGVDGPYYPLQVRGILENFHLSLPDMPLLFILEALLARFFQLLHLGTIDECIILAIAFTDVILTPIVVIPVFLLSKELNKGKTKFLTYLIACYSIINITTILRFTNNFQKNSIGVVLVFFYLYFLFKIFKYSKKKDIYYALGFLLACTLTHFGSASIALLMTGVLFITSAIMNKKVFISFSYNKIIILISFATFFLTTLFIFDYARFERLLYLPLKIFESPVILMILDGYNIGKSFNPLNLISPNLLAIPALLLFISIRKKIEKEIKIMGVGLLISTFILASPLIGIEWAERFYMMSYIPITIIYVILFNKVTKKWTLIFPAFLFILLISFSLLGGYKNSMLPSITNEAYEELKEIKNKVPLNEEVAIVSGQGLKILASWEFRTKGIAPYLLLKNDLLQYDAVYFLIQKNGVNYSLEDILKTEIPSNSTIVYQGNFFDLYKINEIDNSTYEINSRPKLKGIIVDFNNNKVILQSKISKKKATVITSNKTQYHFLPPQNKLKKGMLVEVWGEGIAFSLNLKAYTIVEKK